ncbi:MAG TPA: hypothetical protein PKB12_01410 [Elusimicrobiota bacterium]|nr:hypothetical protein [Elusimicrobiota bacterium]HND63439.1 hypothetical protein [Elusimicrobiota bacterium]HNI56223.1 hypothetical protein [Elusimicrobiota bacterium]
MMAYAVRLLDAFAQGHLVGFSRLLRAAALGLLVLAAVGPLGPAAVRWAIRRWPWWRCHKCGRFNRKAHKVCDKCLAGLSDAVLRPPPVPRPGAFYRWVLRPWRWVWAILFYPLALLAVSLTGVWGGDHRALELSAAALFLVFGVGAHAAVAAALGPWSAFVELRLVRAFWAFILAGLSAGALFLWCMSPLAALPGNRTFAVSPAGGLRFVGAARDEIRLLRDPRDGAVIVPVAGAVFRWPAFGIERWVVTRIAGTATTPGPVRWLTRRMATPARGGWVSPFAARVQEVTLAINVLPPGAYDVAQDERTGELTVKARK